MSAGTAEFRAEAARLQAFFKAAGAVPVEADMLLPAETLLDLYGEDIRARAYVTDDVDRGEMMLRPDFTVPVVQAHMAHGAEPARYTYMGEVFRNQPVGSGRATESLQVGYELFAREAPEAADAEVFALFDEALSPLGLRAVTGDIGILLAAIASLSAGPRRKAALRRHIWRPQRFRALLDRYTGASAPDPARERLLSEMAQGGPEALLSEAGPEIGLRGRAEVLDRLAALAEDQAADPIPGGEAEVLLRLLAMEAPMVTALGELRTLSVELPGLASAVDRFEARMEALDQASIDIAGLPFEASYGRTTMEYYDGFVFGFVAEGQVDWPPVATGGRYDALTRVLGGGREIPAVGGVIRPELVARLRAEMGQ